MLWSVDLQTLQARIASGEGVVGGVLSGTSADGIDVALARFRRADGRLELAEVLATAVEPFPGPLAGRLRAVLDGAPCGLRETALLHRDLGHAFGAAARGVARAAGVELELLGSHGQTLWHHDGNEPSGPATLQLGDGDQVAEAAGCCVVSDLRARDVAAGGQGAPISAYADDLLFARGPRPLVVLNLGGMANLTWIDGPVDSGPPVVLTFDTGPAGSLLDGVARRLLDRPWDEGGRVALSGRADPRLVEFLLDHPFLAAAPPKSTGRDTFGAAYVAAFIAKGAGLAKGAGASPADLLASAVGFVAEAVALGMERHLPGAPQVVLVAGGGGRNRALVQALERRLAAPLASSSTLGIDPDGREALVFATLAARCLVGEGVTRFEATGAAPGRLLGKISPPNPSSPGCREGHVR